MSPEGLIQGKHGTVRAPSYCGTGGPGMPRREGYFAVNNLALSPGRYTVAAISLRHAPIFTAGRVIKGKYIFFVRKFIPAWFFTPAFSDDGGGGLVLVNDYTPFSIKYCPVHNNKGNFVHSHRTHCSCLSAASPAACKIIVTADNVLCK